MNKSWIDLRTARTPVLTFPALAAMSGISHGFIGRVPDVDVAADRAEALRKLVPVHDAIWQEQVPAAASIVYAEQTHGDQVAYVRDAEIHIHPGCDGLMTNVENLCLGIYVADCGAVFLVDPVKRAISLVHSGKKGTELKIVSKAILAMQAQFNSNPRDLVACLGPCIRPPEYEVDFAADILDQCRSLGVQSIHDCGINTGADVKMWYSYRMEKSKTGRMLAWLCLVGE